MMGFWQRNAFVLGLPLAVGLAWLLPEPGASGGWLHPEITTRACVVLIFFFQGLMLPTATVRQGALNWRLHLLVQLFIFVAFPLAGLAFDGWAGNRLPPDFRLGLLFLCVLPSTISSSVVLTALARGNTIGAIFNAVLSNLLGVVITPLWIAWILRSQGGSLRFGPLIGEIAILLLVPLAAGQAMRLRPQARSWAEGHRGQLGHLSSALILFIVYAAFANSVQDRAWERHGVELTLIGLVIVGGFFGVALASMVALGRMLALDRADRITAIFCGAQKTLATGVPLAQVIFGEHPGIGLILLPVMLYHPLQLLVCGMLAGRWSHDALPLKSAA